jgi:hypothetical protein
MSDDDGRHNARIDELSAGSLIMVFQKDHGKLDARWRGPFRVVSFAGSHV